MGLGLGTSSLGQNGRSWGHPGRPICTEVGNGMRAFLAQILNLLFNQDPEPCGGLSWC